MVRALEEEKEIYKSRLGHFKGMHNQNEGRRTKSMIEESLGSLSDDVDNDRMASRSHASPSSNDETSDHPKNGWALSSTDTIKSRLSNEGSVGGSPRARDKQSSDMELMKEKFAKLLLGEDMSGGGKGVSSALALSNAITNLAASVFGEQKKLEPMSAENKVRWREEIDWLLSVTDHIVELVPSKQRAKDGTNMDIMVTKQRTDLQMNIPALRKLDAMLLDCLDNFKDQNEFYYTKADDEESQKGKNARKNDKWWIPTPKVPQNGLSDVTKKWLQFQKDSVNQVLKAAMAINAQVLSEMEIPESYIETLPKNGRASLGDVIYKSITDDQFDPDYLLQSLDLSSEHKILDLKNKIEASVVIWKRKMNDKNSKSSWSSAVSLEKREILEDRAETILLILKHRFPGLPQSSLDITKIQDNRDVGQACLESYSRIIESLAFTVLSRIDDVMHADSLARDPSSAEQKRFCPKEPSPNAGYEKSPSSREESKNTNLSESPNAMTLLDFMGWNLEQGEADTKKDLQDDIATTNCDIKPLVKPPNVSTKKKMSYIERLENLGGSRSPTARH